MAEPCRRSTSPPGVRSRSATGSPSTSGCPPMSQRRQGPRPRRGLARRGAWGSRTTWPWSSRPASGRASSSAVACSTAPPATPATSGTCSSPRPPRPGPAIPPACSSPRPAAPRSPLRTGAPAADAGTAVRARTGTLVGRAVASVANLLDLRLAVVAGSVALGYGDAVLRRGPGRGRPALRARLLRRHPGRPGRPRRRRAAGRRRRRGAAGRGSRCRRALTVLGPQASLAVPESVPMQPTWGESAEQYREKVQALPRRAPPRRLEGHRRAAPRRGPGVDRAVAADPVREQPARHLVAGRVRRPRPDRPRSR